MMNKVLITLGAAFIFLSGCSMDTPTPQKSESASSSQIPEMSETILDKKAFLRDMKILIADAGWCSSISKDTETAVLLQRTLGKEERSDDGTCVQGIDTQYTQTSVSLDGSTSLQKKTLNAFGMEDTAAFPRTIVAPNKLMEIIAYDSKNDEATHAELGNIFLKEFATGERIKLLAGTFLTGYEGKYVRSRYEVMGFSPNSRWLLVRNNQHTSMKEDVWTPEYGLIDLTSAEKVYEVLGEVPYREVGRGNMRIVWSPDSSKVSIEDSMAVFDVLHKKIIFTPATTTLGNSIEWSRGGMYALFRTVYNEESGQKIMLQVIDTSGVVLRTLDKNIENGDQSMWISDKEVLVLHDGMLTVHNILQGSSYDLPLPQKTTVQQVLVMEEGKSLVLYGAGKLWKVHVTR